MWEIIDDKGTIFSGTEEEMKEQFRKIESNVWKSEDSKGDIKLVQIHATISKPYQEYINKLLNS